MAILSTILVCDTANKSEKEITILSPFGATNYSTGPQWGNSD